MRDIKRLDGFYNELKSIHKKYFPDLRFLQLFNNFYTWIFTHKKLDPFFIEEDKALQYFEEYIENIAK